jgi:hypothetical protein
VRGLVSGGDVVRDWCLFCLGSCIYELEGSRATISITNSDHCTYGVVQVRLQVRARDHIDRNKRTLKDPRETEIGLLIIFGKLIVSIFELYTTWAKGQMESPRAMHRGG